MLSGGAGLAVLFLAGLGIEDLSGLECAASVEQLFLEGNRIEDVSVRARLPRLYQQFIRPPKGQRYTPQPACVM